MGGVSGACAILGLGLATPNTRVGREHAAALACAISGATDGVRVRVERLFERSGVESRAVVILHADGAGTFYDAAGGATTTGARMGAYEAHASDLCARAASEALAASRSEARSITHLVTASCTGFASPGVDIDLIERLGLSRTVERTHVGFMGCHAAVNALRVGRALVGASPASRVLIACVELCSLHFDG